MLTVLPLLTCPTCGLSLARAPEEPSVQSCPRCRRPILVLRSPLGRRKGGFCRNLLDLGFAFYGLATIALFILFLVTGLPNRQFVRLFAVLLFAFGSLSCIDGVLGLWAAVDRTLGRIQFGRAARLSGAAKIGIGAIALALSALGLSL